MAFFEKTPLDKEIDRAIESLQLLDPVADEAAYQSRLEALGKLLEVREKQTRANRIDPNVLLEVAASLFSTMFIIHAERTDIVGRSKSWNERPKVRIRVR